MKKLYAREASSQKSSRRDSAKSSSKQREVKVNAQATLLTSNKRVDCPPKTGQNQALWERVLGVAAVATGSILGKLRGGGKALEKFGPVIETLTRYASGKLGRTEKALAGLCGLNSFKSTTPILSINGLVPIAALAIGTPVLAFNEQTGQNGYYPVTAVHKNQDPAITYLTINDPEQHNQAEHITTTPEHPFYVKERSDQGTRPKPVGHEDLNANWVGAGHLKIGDKIKQADGTTGVVANVTTVQQTQEMFNLTVDEAHTFYVGVDGWLVHNGCYGILESRINLAKGPTRFTPLRQSGNHVSAGWDHVVSGHFGRPVSNSRSVFTVTPDELGNILTYKSVVSSPVRPDPNIPGMFIRDVDVGTDIGLTTLRDGGVATSRMRVFTDSKGNLVTSFPIK